MTQWYCCVRGLSNVNIFLNIKENELLEDWPDHIYAWQVLEHRKEKWNITYNNDNNG